MSWEGFYQCFCANGHFFVDDPYVEQGCPFCKAKTVVTNVVDETNCEGYGYIPDNNLQSLLISEARVEECNLGHLHVLEETRFRIPTQEELESLRTYRDCQGNLLPLKERE